MNAKGLRKHYSNSVYAQDIILTTGIRQPASKFSLLAFDDCMTSAVFGILDAFAIADRLAYAVGDDQWQQKSIRLVTPSGGPVTGAGGYRIEGHAPLSTTSDGDVVIAAPIMGDIDATLKREAHLINWLSRLRPGPVLIASACTGAFLLAEAGLLENRQITTNPRYQGHFRSRYPSVSLALAERVIEDRGIVCSGATTAYLDLAIYLIGKVGSRELAIATAKAMSMGTNPSPQQAYISHFSPSNHGDERVLQVQQWIAGNYNRVIHLTDLVRIGGMGERNLGRRFRQATGQSPMEYLRNTRIDAAKHLLETRAMPIDQVANHVGYSDTRAFIRAFGCLVGMAPGQYRQTFRTKPDATSAP